MKRLFFITFFLFLPLQLFAAVAPSTRAYLAAAGNDPWVVMGRAAIGDTAVSVSVVKDSVFSLAKSILALAAVGKDARSAQGEDLVDLFLRLYMREHQIGNIAQVNDDFWGVLALAAAGVPSTYLAVADARAFTLKAQQQSGGWSWSAADSMTDTDDTAAAVMALFATGVSPQDPAIATALTYLRAAQNSDGGFPNVPSGISSVDSTAWVVMALAAAGEDSARAQTFLRSRMLSDGSWGSPATTAFAAIALSGKWFPVVPSAGFVSDTDANSAASPAGRHAPVSGKTVGLGGGGPSENAMPQQPQPSSRAPLASDKDSLPSTPPLRSPGERAADLALRIEPNTSLSFSREGPSLLSFPPPFPGLAAQSVFSKSERHIIVAASPRDSISRPHPASPIRRGEIKGDERGRDSDGDGYPDDVEIANGYDPKDARPMKKSKVQSPKSEVKKSKSKRAKKHKSVKIK